jgi:hypothetical protein
MPRIRVSVQCLGERHSLVKFNARIAMITQTLKRAGKNGRRARVVAGYFGFPDQDAAMTFVRNIQGRFPKARVQVRAAERLGTAVEVKVSGEFVEALCWELLRNTQTTGQRVERHLQAVASMPSVRPDAPALPRHTRRELVTVGGRAVGID